MIGGVCPERERVELLLVSNCKQGGSEATKLDFHAWKERLTRYEKSLSRKRQQQNGQKSSIVFTRARWSAWADTVCSE